MAVTAADIQAMPGLSAVATGDADFWIDESAQWVSSVFGAADSTTRDRATRYWVAHALTIQTSAGMASAGAVTARKVGDVSIGYAAGESGGAADWLSQTQWGGLFLRMARVYAAPSLPVV